VGEVVILGFQKNFPIFVLSGWSSGTGLAGIFGTLTYLFLKSMEVPNKVTFFVMSILVTQAYWLIYRFLS
jgi:battenin